MNMLRKRLLRALTVILGSGMVLLTGCNNCSLGTDPFTQAASLEFPLARQNDVERLSAYGTPNWSGNEPHNGVDLVLYQTLNQTRVIAPADGKVTAVTVNENPFSNPPNQLMVSVKICTTLGWVVDLVFEPGTVNSATKNAQQNAIRVSAGQQVRAGDDIGDLLVGDLGYAHLHYMVQHRNTSVCPYEYSSDAAKAEFQAIADRSGTRPCY